MLACAPLHSLHLACLLLILRFLPTYDFGSLHKARALSTTRPLLEGAIILHWWVIGGRRGTVIAAERPTVMARGPAGEQMNVFKGYTDVFKGQTGCKHGQRYKTTIIVGKAMLTISRRDYCRCRTTHGRRHIGLPSKGRWRSCSA